MKSGRRPVGWDGHVLLLHRTERQRRDGVVSWVRSGLEAGAKILYTEPRYEPSSRSLTGLLRGQAGAGEALERGQITVVLADEGAYDPARLEDLIAEALDQGFPSVCWSGEAKTAWDVMPRARHAEVERATDELCLSHPVSVMCQYSVRESVEVLQDVCALHGAGLRERLFQASRFERGVSVAGEIDMSNQDILRLMLLAATSTTERDDFVVDMSRLDFLDVGGTRALLSGTRPYRGVGGRVWLRAPQPHVERLISILGIDRTLGVLTEEAG